MYGQSSDTVNRICSAVVIRATAKHPLNHVVVFSSPFIKALLLRTQQCGVEAMVLATEVVASFGVLTYLGFPYHLFVRADLLYRSTVVAFFA